MAVGATVNHFWERRSPKTFDMYGFALAAGIIAGEGVGGVMNAILAVANVEGSIYGTAVGKSLLSFRSELPAIVNLLSDSLGVRLPRFGILRMMIDHYPRGFVYLTRQDIPS